MIRLWAQTWKYRVPLFDGCGFSNWKLRMEEETIRLNVSEMRYLRPSCRAGSLNVKKQKKEKRFSEKSEEM